MATCSNCVHYYKGKNYCDNDGGLTRANDSCLEWESCKETSANEITLHNTLDEIKRLEDTLHRIRGLALESLNNTTKNHCTYRETLDTINTVVNDALTQNES